MNLASLIPSRIVFFVSSLAIVASSVIFSQQAHAASDGRLTATLTSGQGKITKPGLYSLHLEQGRDGYLFIPSNYNPAKPAPFVMFLHGNRGEKNGSLDTLRAQAEARGVVLLIPESRKRTWDRIIDDEFGPDLDYIDRALKVAFAAVTIDPRHVGIAGFSDGASYSLALGQTNGDLFTHIAAFSPGGSEPASQNGRPPVFIIHGVQDDILPIDQCSRTIVPELQKAGYTVDYHEFQGMHLVTDEGKAMMMNWFLN